MAWSDLTFTGCTVLTAAQLTQMQANFAALAQGAPGAPPIAPASLMWTGQASGASLNVSSAAAVGTLLLRGSPAGTPDGNTLYKESPCKAWVRFNMATDAIADSFNISSITDGAAGSDTINWDRDFANANYAIAGAIGRDTARQILMHTNLFAGSAPVSAYDFDSGAAYDNTRVHIAAFGDQ